MLNIPDSVKQLYMRDGVRKNFRVTFPNGELPDITNEQIVEESVKFNESIMSQNKFRFGLAESPQISFECVGVSNMLGMQIQCWHEIDVTSLSAADIAAIEAGTWDGEYIPLNDSDLGFAYFRLPLGIFTVDECPRSHGAMNHRQVKATGKSIGTNEEALDPFTKWKISQQYTSKTWYINWDFLSPSVYGTTWAEAGKYYDRTLLTSTEYSDQTPSFHVAFTLPSEGRLGKIWSLFVGSSVQYQEKPCNVTGKQITIRGTLLHISRLVSTYNAIAAKLRENIEEQLQSIDSRIDWDTGHTYTGEMLGGRTGCINYMVKTIMEAYLPSFTVDGKPYEFSIYDDVDLIVDTGLPNGVDCVVKVPYKLSDWYLTYQYITSSGGGEASATAYKEVPQTTVDGTEIGFYSLALKDEYDVDFPTLKLPTTLKTKVGNTTYYGYYNSFSVRDLLTGFFETNGVFGRIKRDGTLELYTLTTTAAATLSQSDVQELWWDESNILPVGTVKVKFKATETSNELSDAEIDIGNGPSVYNMTNNVMLTGWAITLVQLSSVLRGNFAENVQVLTWTPTDATVRGLPWLEAGDWVVIATGAADVPTVGIPYLDREMSGIQLLTDTITCNSGDTIEVTQ